MITIFGAPGAGKTEQGRLLAQKYNWTWISYRDLMMKFGDRDIRFALDHGMYIDDKIAAQVMESALSEVRDEARPILASNRRAGFGHEIVLDGFPSDYRQVKWMIDSGEIKNLTGAIILRVPRGELWRRLVLRKRVDDTRAAIERRQDYYDQQITGMIKTLSKNGVLIREINGENAPGDVLARIEEVLGDWGLVPKKQFAKIATD